MLSRFSLYGFLKNQRYFEPFLLLAMLDDGLGFTEIGVCVAVRELCTNLFEIPSGALADVYGRRRSLMAAFVVYAAALCIFAVGTGFGHFAIAMGLWGLGDAFRSGTHKAMILDWLRLQGREDERVRVYGTTRSWSKIGSAVSSPIAAATVWWAGNTRAVFWLTLAPYAANFVNLATYPRALDGLERDRSGGLTAHLRESLGVAWGRPGLRALFAEAMALQGTYKATKDYLQPLLQALAVALPAGALVLDEERRTAVLVGAAYLVLFAVSAFASRHAWRVVELAGGHDAAARLIWWAWVASFALLLPLLLTDLRWGAVAVFIALSALQNVFRPVLVARIDSLSEPRLGATMLSLESQAGALTTLMLAPAIGWMVDSAGGGDPTTWALWPLAAAGLAVGALAVGLRR